MLDIPRDKLDMLLEDAPREILLEEGPRDKPFDGNSATGDCTKQD